MRGPEYENPQTTGPRQGELAALREQLAVMGKRAAESRSRLHQKLDELQGPRPLPGNPSSTERDKPRGLLAEVHDLVESLDRELTAIAAGTERVEAL